MSDPAVQTMNSTQWTFELASLVEQDKRKYDDIASLVKVSRKTLIDLLGLNMLPQEDSTTDENGNVITRLRRPEDNEILPLVSFCGSEGVLSEIHKKQQELFDQEEIERKMETGEAVELTPEELDDFFNEDDGDILFAENPQDLEKKLKWESKENKALLKQMVMPMNKKDENLNGGPKLIEGPRRQSSRLKIK